MKQFGNSFGSGFGVTLGILAALVVAGLALKYGAWLNEPVKASPKEITVGSADQATSAALSALRKRGIRDLASEVRASFYDNRWLVHGPAKTDDGRLVRVEVLLSVGTIDGTRHWKTEYMEIDGKQYLGR